MTYVVKCLQMSHFQMTSEVTEIKCVCKSIQAKITECKERLGLTAEVHLSTKHYPGQITHVRAMFSPAFNPGFEAIVDYYLFVNTFVNCTCILKDCMPSVGVDTK